MKRSRSQSNLHQKQKPSALDSKHCKKKRSLLASEETRINSVEPSSKRPKLTRKNLRLCEMQSSTTQFQSQRSHLPTLSTTKTSRSKSIPTSDSMFGNAANTNHINDPTTSAQPANLDDWKDILNRSRDTASPDETEYMNYSYNICTAESEATIIHHQSEKLLKEYNVCESKYRKTYSETLCEVPPNLGFNNGLSNAQPDFLEGYDLSAFRPFEVREKLGGTAVLKRGPTATTLPHFAGEWKGPGKSLKKADMQAAYDAAILVYGRKRALSYLGCPDPENHANVATFTSDGTILQIYTHHSTYNGEFTEYHQTPIHKVMLTASFEDYKSGRRTLRNVQDAARVTASSLKDDLISSLNSRGDIIARELINNANLDSTIEEEEINQSTTDQNAVNIAIESGVAEHINNITSEYDMQAPHSDLINPPPSAEKSRLSKGQSRKAKSHLKRTLLQPMGSAKSATRQATHHRYSLRSDR
ncbi:hypothetical protein H4I96_03604 [Botrytis cinerea]